MQRNRPLSAQAVSVLRALAAEPARWRYGYDLGAEVHLKSGSLYPILVRLADRGLLEATWEPGPEGRPPRHLYRLSTAGREYVAALPATRDARTAPSPHPRLSQRSEASWVHSS
jgi:PadR family transcriptional regulator, regulatory protein PadR